MPTTKKKVRHSVSHPPAKPAKIKVVHMQLYFDQSLDLKVQKFMFEENQRLQLVGRDQKVHKYKAYPMLVDYGVKYREHGVYLPEDKAEQLMNDVVFVEQYRKAQSEMSALHEMMKVRVGINL